MRLRPSTLAPWTAALALAAGASAARAQPAAEAAVAEPDTIDALVDGPETPELRALRELEEELFGPSQSLAEPIEAPARIRVSEGPSAITSDAPPARARAEHTGAPARDLSWLRGLTLPELPVRWDARVIRFLEFFRDDPRGRRFIEAWLERVDRYGPMIRAALAREGLPEDLIFVAMVESGFDPRARSHAGAVGMWQFVERTGESFDLHVTHWVDLRQDPELSTVAAGRYLRQLHDRFGSWELALAAYNMGYGALLRAIRKYNSNDYWELSHLEAGLPFDTSIYVSKILACAIVARNLERFGLGDLDREAPLEWETVEVPGGVPLGQLARAAGVDLEAMRRLNPALRRDRTPPGPEAVAVRIPRAQADAFAQRWARMRPSDPVARPRVLRFGETLADVARETGASIEELRELNGASEDEHVGAGTTLLVPVTARRDAQAAADRPVVTVPEGPRELPGRRRVFYRAARGDRLDEIARFFRVTADEVREWNAIDPSAALQPGMFLQLFVRPEVDLAQAVVWTPDECRVLVLGSEEFFDYHEQQNGRVRFRYRVRAGDTLGHLAERFGLEVASISRINQIARDSILHPGDELVIYAEPGRVPPELRREAAGGDALAPGGEATVERTGPAIGPDGGRADGEPGDATEQPVERDDPDEVHPSP